MEMSIQDAIKKFYHIRGWDSKIAAIRIEDEWIDIVGNTIAHNTNSIRLVNKVLIINCGVPILRHELLANKLKLIDKINAHFKSRVLDDIRVMA